MLSRAIVLSGMRWSTFVFQKTMYREKVTNLLITVHESRVELNNCCFTAILSEWEEWFRCLEFWILIIDHPTNRAVADHRIPWSWLEPYYQYHFNLQVPHQSRPTICLYVSIMLKESSLSREDIRYFGIEALLDKFDVPLVKPQSIYAVARIIPDYKSYRSVISCFSFLNRPRRLTMLPTRDEYLRNPLNKKLGVRFQRIVSPNEQDFRLPAATNNGYPQISLLSKPVSLDWPI